MTRVLFVNGGILGLISFRDFLAEALPQQNVIDGTQLVLTENLSLLDRVIRRAMCQRLWIDGTLGLRNIDLARFRHELHAGVLARRRIAACGIERFDVLHFHRQATAYGSLDLMRTVPSVVSIDCTQDCVIQDASSSAERASYGPNVRIDGAIFRRAAAVISTSDWAKDTLERRYPRLCDTRPRAVQPRAAESLRSPMDRRARDPESRWRAAEMFVRRRRLRAEGRARSARGVAEGPPL